MVRARMHSLRLISDRFTALVQRRKLNLKPKFESASSHFAFKRLHGP
jgi:hypothetical protein